MTFETYKGEADYDSAETANKIKVKLTHSALFGMRDEL